MDLTIDCKIYKAKLTREGCNRNQCLAVDAANQVRGCNPRSILVLDDVEVDRLAGCGRCPRAKKHGIENVFVDAVTRDITILVDEVLDENFYDLDKEEARERRLETYRKYNTSDKGREREKRRQVTRLLQG